MSGKDLPDNLFSNEELSNEKSAEAVVPVKYAQTRIWGRAEQQ